MEHLHNGILLGPKREENFALCDTMDGLGECYDKWYKPVRERQIPYDFTQMWNLMNKQTNKQNETDSQIESRWQLWLGGG